MTDTRVWLAATVPGPVDAGRVALERHGTMSLGVLLEDAINNAERGFPLTARQARDNREMEPIAAAFGETVAIFFPDGHPPPAGYVLRQPDLARTLRTLQADGPSAF